MKHESDGDTSCNWSSRYSHQRIGKETGGFGNKWTSRDHPNYRITKIVQNTGKSLGNSNSCEKSLVNTRVKNSQKGKIIIPSWRMRRPKIQTDHQISTRPRDRQKKKKKKSCQIVDFGVPADYKVRLKENEKKKKRDKYLDLTWELQTLWNIKVTAMPIIIRALGKIPKLLFKGLGDFKITGQVDIIQTSALIGQNTEESPGELRRLTVSHSPMKNYQLTLVWKTLKE